MLRGLPSAFPHEAHRLWTLPSGPGEQHDQAGQHHATAGSSQVVLATTGAGHPLRCPAPGAKTGLFGLPVPPNCLAALAVPSTA